MKVPTEGEVPESPPPPPARNPTYQALALTAEKVVPSTWWRRGFADPKLLLSNNNDDLPRKLFDARLLTNKKLKNIYQCVSRQQFMRSSFDFVQSQAANETGKCQVLETTALKRFQSLWQKYSTDLDGEYSKVNETAIWLPKGSESGELFMAASDLLETFYTLHGGIWTGCFALERSVACRGALAGWNT
jgi:hypothetical protein